VPHQEHLPDYLFLAETSERKLDSFSDDMAVGKCDGGLGIFFGAVCGTEPIELELARARV
jgi:hypothetical protein